MTDLREKLANPLPQQVHVLTSDHIALADIQALFDRIAVMEAVLEPFAAVADEYDDSEDDHFEVWMDAGPVKAIRASFHLGLYRQARAARQRAGQS